MEMRDWKSRKDNAPIRDEKKGNSCELLREQINIYMKLFKEKRKI
jgi:hypothetical protein